MRALPRKDPYHKGLKTNYVFIESLVKELRKEEFNGFIELLKEGYKGLILIKNGNVIDARHEINGEEKDAPAVDVMKRILEESRAPEGIINVFKLPEQLTLYFSRQFRREPLYKDLSTSFIDPVGLVAKLQKERFTGHIEIVFPQEEGNVAIFLKDGKIINTLFIPKEGDIINDVKITSKLLEKAKSTESSITVFAAPKTNSQIKQQPHSEANNTKTIKKKTEFEVIISFLNTLLSKTEEVVDRELSEGQFEYLFKRTFSEIADNYPFLDPLVGDLTYNKGTISLNTNIPIKELLEGMGSALSRVIFLLSEKIPKDKLISSVRAEIEDLFKRERGILTKAGVNRFFSEILEGM